MPKVEDFPKEKKDKDCVEALVGVVSKKRQE